MSITLVMDILRNLFSFLSKRKHDYFRPKEFHFPPKPRVSGNNLNCEPFPPSPPLLSVNNYSAGRISFTCKRAFTIKRYYRRNYAVAVHREILCTYDRIFARKWLLSPPFSIIHVPSWKKGWDELMCNLFVVIVYGK